MKRLLSSVWIQLALALVMIAASLTGYLFIRDSLNLPEWQVQRFDHADYRYIAEHFWGIEHNYSTYRDEFAGNWGNYLNIVPFREIGVGTYYLAVRGIVWFWPGPVTMEQLSFIFPKLIFLFFALSYLFFWFICRKYNSSIIAFLCLGLFLIPLESWGLSAEMLSEPLQRIIFILLLSFLIIPKLKTWHYAVIMTLMLISVHIKSSLLLLAGIITLAFIARFLWQKKYKPAAAIAGFGILIPLSLFFVHWYGWGYHGLTAGSGLHVNYVTKGNFVKDLCTDEPDALICDRDHWNRYWMLNLPLEFTTAEAQEVDKLGLNYLLSKPELIKQKLKEGIELTSNMPAGFIGQNKQGTYPRNIFTLALDITIWIVLIAGLILQRTWQISLYGLTLWLIPAVGNVLSPFTTRYQRPATMVGLCIVVLVCYGIFVLKKEDHENQ